MNPFKQRSSFPSSIVTGLVGWIGFIFIGSLIFGFKVPSEILLLLGLASALVQTVFLRLTFFVLRMHKHILIGAFWGLVTAVGIFYATTVFYSNLKTHQLYWLIIYAYIGAPVGAFLSYFYIDDKKIFDAVDGQKSAPDFGRDAHWLEPFGFGAIAYLLAFFPFAHFDLTVNVFLVGAMSGVFAAGASHFSPDKWKQSFIVLAIIILGLGSLQGWLTGFLFRAYAEQLYTNNLVHGIAGGVITYLMTFLRGRQLANKEGKGSL
ncbi:MAG: hypothetical protein IPI59_05820 [Sphingobacteriales bacterium]|jgi:hypothetical protein|nr:hypothetical protein [Sphingobacteriales bacterium]MBP9141643.1 hypothetical protein [Chitinophagales bacterium]MDA0198829.1 hypothetical protein [Bacteroidota bacterium]MBK6891106.1 hypothetical protein [Sphingobacteriales bacterium]MBK7527067.1 hypothetical protein [Sphingobacteriales bacterium]